MMFREKGPRLFGLESGADFPRRLAEGVIARLHGQPPEAMGRVTIFLNSQRMRRRVREAFIQTGACFLPRLRLVSETGDDPLLTARIDSVTPLARRLELAVLIDHLLKAEPDLAPRSALYDLADSLAALMDEMRAENVAPEKLETLDIEGHAAHWSRTRRFVSLISQFFGPDAQPDSEARLRAATLARISAWEAAPTPDPVIVAGSTGSRGTTALLMLAVAKLPQGALLVPGFDFDQPAEVWASLGDHGGQEDHPQYRYLNLMNWLEIGPEAVRPWDKLGAPDPARNRLLSLALRPAPVTDQWISDGPLLGDLVEATRNVTLIEAPNPRAEAQAIALKLREAVAKGQSAALLTPDRDLTRRVTAALDRWRLSPDDSAGEPLIHSAPGRLLRLIVRAMGKRLMADEVLTLLKHPLVFSTSERGPHLRLSRELELHLRAKGPAFPDLEFLTHWAATLRDEFAPVWAEWLGQLLARLAAVTPDSLPTLISEHRDLAEAFAGGRGDDDLPMGKIWSDAAGEAALSAMETLAAHAPAALHLTPADYAALAEGVLSQGQVRSLRPADERIVILGAQEARVQGAQVVILAGLSEGTWPKAIDPDPWLNRKMRKELGLLLPERRIGLSAHDFQMAAAAPEIVLSHAYRSAEAETVPSRWLNRLTNLLDGLPDTGGREALKAMRARGETYLHAAVAVEAPIVAPPAHRPSPRPPVALRPTRLSLTAVEKLIRDPYAIYAINLLKLRGLAPLRPMADARLRGEVLHKVPEAFLKDGLPTDLEAGIEHLLSITDEVLARDVAWPAMRAIWRTRMQELARPFTEQLLKEQGRPVSLERKYGVEIDGTGFTLIGQPDRIDLTPDGGLKIVDYKTGTPPSKEMQKTFAKQLQLAAVMAWLGAFKDEVGLHEVIDIAYVRLAKDLKTVDDRLGPNELAQILGEFKQLIAAWKEPLRGYTSRRAMLTSRDNGDYDDLARFGEWGVTDMPKAEDVG